MLLIFNRSVLHTYEAEQYLSVKMAVIRTALSLPDTVCGISGIFLHILQPAPVPVLPYLLP